MTFCEFRVWNSIPFKTLQIYLWATNKAVPSIHFTKRELANIDTWRVVIVRVCANEIFDCEGRINNNTFNYTHTSKATVSNCLSGTRSLMNERRVAICFVVFWWNEFCCDIFPFSIISSSISYFKALMNCTVNPFTVCQRLFQMAFVSFSFVLLLFE